MITATQPLHRRIALVFDFDATLAPSSIDATLRHLGIDADEFRRRRMAPLLEDGWEIILAGFYTFIQESRSRAPGDRITRELLEEVGRGLEPYPGVAEMFERLRGWAREIVPDVEVEFYVLTSGHAEIHRASRVAGEFRRIWGSEFHFNEEGEAEFPKKIVTFQEKEQYLLALSKGLDTDGANSPDEVYRTVSEENLYVPLDQVIYVGDGGSDMPVFSLLHKHGGIAIGVFQQGERAEDWSAQKEVRPERRVHNLAPADFRENSELLRSLRLAVESICKRIALLQLGVGE